MNNSYIVVDDKAFVATSDDEMVVRDAFVDMKEILELENKIELIEKTLDKNKSRLENYESLKISGLKLVKNFVLIVLVVSCCLPFLLSGMLQLFGVVSLLGEFIPITIGMFSLFIIPSSLILVPEIKRINKNISGLKYVVEKLTSELKTDQDKLKVLNEVTEKCSYQKEIIQYQLDNKKINNDLMEKIELLTFLGQQENKIKRLGSEEKLKEYLETCGYLKAEQVEQIYSWLQKSEEETIEENKVLSKKLN